MKTLTQLSTIALGLAATAYAADVVINDFETSSGGAYIYDHNGWDGNGVIGNTYTVNPDDGSKAYTVWLTEAAAGESTHGIGVLVGDGDVGFTIGLPVSELEGCAEISYDYQGAAHKLAIESNGDNANTGDFHYSKVLSAVDEWTVATVDVSNTKRYSGRNNLDMGEVIAFRWDVGKGTGLRYLYVDNVKCIKPVFYKISFMNGETLLDEVETREGTMPEYSGVIPEKESDKDYDYYFAGWDPKLVPVTGEATYNVVFGKTPVYSIPEGETVLIEDFEKCEGTEPCINKWNGKFWMDTDKGDGGASEVSYEFSQGETSNVAKLTYLLDQGTITSYDPFVRIAIDVNESGIRDLSTCKVVKYDYKGSRHNFRVRSIYDVGYNYHMKSVPKSNTWKTETVVVASQLRQQPGWGIKVDIADVMKRATVFDWDIQATSGTEGVLEIDNVRCLNVPVYTVTFMDGEDEVDYATVVAGDMPKCDYCGYWNKSPSESHEYTFSGTFTPEIVAATANTSYQMVWDSTLRKFTVTFYDADDNELESADWEYGTTPKYNGETPVKKGDVQYSYVFDGWGRELAKVEGTDEYHAQFKSVVNKYTVAFVNDDGSPIASGEYDYGTSVLDIKPGQDPIKEDPEGHVVYEFDGWVPEINDETEVVGNVTYTATYKTDNNEYTVTFMNGNEVLKTVLVKNGDIPEYLESYPVPTRDADAEFTYTWDKTDGWEPALAAMEGKSVTYYAKFNATRNKYIVTFKDDNGTVLGTPKEYEYGTTIPEEDIPAISRSEAEYDEQYGMVGYYDYDIWDWIEYQVPNYECNWPTMHEVTGDATYTLQCLYRVTFVQDGWEETHQYAYGEKPVPENEPYGYSSDKYEYFFKGWKPAIEAVGQHSATYFPEYDSTLITYYVKFVVGSTTIDSTDYPAGTLAKDVKVPENVTKEPTSQYSYRFVGWNKDIADVTKNAMYTAVFEEVERGYVVTFIVNGVKTSAEYAYDTKAEDLKVPATDRAATAQYTYTFKSWDKALANVTESATYTAVYDSTVNTYTITFVVEGVSTPAEYAYGTKAADLKTPATTKPANDQYTYNFKAWDKTLADVTGAATYTAQFDSVVNQYWVKFVVDGKADSAKYDYGTKVADLKVPATDKAANAQYTYAFKAWDKALADVKAAATYTAQFDSVVNQYLVKFVVDGKADSAKYDYGTKVADLKVPATDKAANDQYTYTFKAWDVALADVKAAATYTALFDSTVNKYWVKFVIDGKADSIEVAYGTKADSLKIPDAKKEATAQYTYTFKAWDKELGDVTGTVSYTAVFDSTVNKYWVKFVVDGKADSVEVAYGTKADSLKIPATKKEATAKYTYTFKAWDKKLADVEGNVTYTAVFDSTVNKYLVKFVVDGKVVASAEYAYGTKAADIEVPKATKKDTKDSSYTFDGWDVKIADVTGAVTYTAKFTAKKTEAIAATARNNFKFGFANNELTVVQSSASLVRVQVFDLTGHLVESFSETVAGSKSFSLAHLNQGTYLVRIVSKSQMRTARISVK